MVEFITEEDNNDSYSYPSYDDEGRILVYIYGPGQSVYQYETDIFDYEPDSSVFYISEGMGFDYWFDCYIDFPGPGCYVIEGIKGRYIRGRGWLNGEVYEEDDEEWEFSYIRKATKKEEETMALNDDSIIWEELSKVCQS